MFLTLLTLTHDALVYFIVFFPESLHLVFSICVSIILVASSADRASWLVGPFVIGKRFVSEWRKIRNLSTQKERSDRFIIIVTELSLGKTKERKKIGKKEKKKEIPILVLSSFRQLNVAWNILVGSFCSWSVGSTLRFLHHCYRPNAQSTNIIAVPAHPRLTWLVMFPASF